MTRIALRQHKNCARKIRMNLFYYVIQWFGSDKPTLIPAGSTDKHAVVARNGPTDRSGIISENLHAIAPAGDLAQDALVKSEATNN